MRKGLHILIFIVGISNLAYAQKKWVELGKDNLKSPSSLRANDVICKIAVDVKGRVYAAGNFTNKDGYRYVAMYDGYNWSELGSGSNALNANNTILTITCDSACNVYAAGVFSDNGGKNYVARWNGLRWDELGTGANGDVSCLLSDGHGNLYAGGYDSTGLGKWNGKTWKSIVVPSSFAHINDMCLSKDGKVYIVGGTIDSSFQPYSWGRGYAVYIYNDSVYNMMDNYPCYNYENYHACAIDKENNLYTGGNPLVKWNGSYWDTAGLMVYSDINPGSILIDSNNNLFTYNNYHYTWNYSYVLKWNHSPGYRMVGIWPPNEDSIYSNFIGDLKFSKQGNLLAPVSLWDSAYNYYCVAINRIKDTSEYKSSAVPNTYKKINTNVIPTLYPNPADIQVTLDISDTTISHTLWLFDLRGCVIFRKESTNGDEKFILNVSELQNGVYFVKVDDKIQKLVINR